MPPLATRVNDESEDKIGSTENDTDEEVDMPTLSTVASNENFALCIDHFDSKLSELENIIDAIKINIDTIRKLSSLNYSNEDGELEDIDTRADISVPLGRITHPFATPDASENRPSLDDRVPPDKFTTNKQSDTCHASKIFNHELCDYQNQNTRADSFVPLSNVSEHHKLKSTINKLPMLIDRVPPDKSDTMN